jgi:uncharacterized protein YndB with AHSA1/START domain
MEKVKTKITVETSVNAPVDKVWKLWNGPEHIVKWSSAHPDWHTPRAENDLKAGGKFSSRMESKDGKMGFDFWGIYDVVKPNEYIEYTMGDGRKVLITFTSKGNSTHISETFEAENENPVEMQKDGWQNIMNNFKAYAEKN